MSRVAPLTADEEQDLFEIANLYPSTTGLPMTVWVRARGNARHDVRIKVCLAHGPSMDPGNTSVVALRPVPRLVAGDLSTADFDAVRAWIGLNTAALIAYWDGGID